MRRFDAINTQLRLAREQQPGGPQQEEEDQGETVSSSRWGDDVSDEDGYEVASASPSDGAGGIPRPEQRGGGVPRETGERDRRAADQRRRFPAVEDLDMVRASYRQLPQTRL